jgi:ATP-binding cassette, subfamily B, bacterial
VGWSAAPRGVALSTSGDPRRGRRGRTQTVDEIRRPPGGPRDPRRIPRLIAAAFGLVRSAAPRQLTLAGALQVAGGVGLAAQLLVVRRILQRIGPTEQAPDVGAIVPELVAFGLLLLLIATSRVVQREQQRSLGEHIQKYTTARVLDVSTTVDLIDYDRPAFYDALQRARVNASTRPLQIANGLLGLVGSGVAVVSVGITLLYIEPVVVGLIVVGAVPTLLLNRMSSRIVHDLFVRQTAGDRRRGYLYNILSRKEEAQEIRAFDSSAYLRAEHDRLYDARIADVRATIRARTIYGVLAGAVAATVTVGAITLLFTFVRLGRISLADAAVAIGAVILLAGQVRGLAGSTGTLYESALFLEDFTDFVGGEYVRPERSGDRSELQPFDELELRDVSFTYPSRDEPSLHEVSMTLKRGEVVALVGENGSGKTTLTKLLAGLYRPSRGALYWDGTDTAERELAEIRRHVGVIFQDFARYFLTARENVAISDIAEIDDEDRIRAAAADAGADAFLAGLSGAYDALLGSPFYGGSDLSLGQWQRVSLARAYFRDAPLLILDEPTASLDPRGEYEIFQQVRRLARGHTVVLVSHRFSSVRAADRIIVLDAGRIVEEGDHDQLLEKGGLYAELFDLQARGYLGG